MEQREHSSENRRLSYQQRNQRVHVYSHESWQVSSERDRFLHVFWRVCSQNVASTNAQFTNAFFCFCSCVRVYVLKRTNKPVRNEYADTWVERTFVVAEEPLPCLRRRVPVLFAFFLTMFAFQHTHARRLCMLACVVSHDDISLFVIVYDIHIMCVVAWASLRKTCGRNAAIYMFQ